MIAALTLVNSVSEGVNETIEDILLYKHNMYCAVNFTPTPTTVCFYKTAQDYTNDNTSIIVCFRAQTLMTWPIPEEGPVIIELFEGGNK